MQTKHIRHRGQENSKTKKFRAFIEEEDRELLHEDTIAREAQIAESLGKMQVENEDGKDMMMDEGEGHSGTVSVKDVDEVAEDLEGGMAVLGIAEGEEGTVPRSWFSELAICGTGSGKRSIDFSTTFS